MTRFAKDVLKVMNTLTRELETELGPETGDLQMRIGLHSGPVTAGVLRGNNCRFQLFGDTVNTAARMESHGKRDAIHVSEETANLLKEAGKEDWLLERTDKIFAKGKGELTTYFITLRKGSQGPVSVVSASSESQNSAENSNQITASSVGTGLNSRLKRLVTFNSDLLARLIKSVVARREAIKLVQGGRNNNSRPPLYHDSNSRPDGNTVLDEAVDILTLPTFNAKAAAKEKDPKEIELSEEVIKQIHQYITVIASMYRREVPFHNFEHAR